MTSHQTWRFPLALALATLLGCRAPESAAERTPSPERGVVVCVDPVAAEVGASILRRGGNAVDAAVATAFALAVTWPPAGNLGGGGFLLLHRADDGRDLFLDFRETAPAGATETMFLDARGRIDEDASVVTGLASGVPGSPRGLEEAWRRHGSLPWADLVAPAIALARDGIVVRDSLARTFARPKLRARLVSHPETVRVFGLADGASPRAGGRLVQPDLARTLERLAADGADALHEGPIASAIAESVRRAGGVMSEADLAAYRPVWREPVRGTYRGHEIVSAPPPSSGGTVLVEMLNVLEGFDFAGRGATLDDPRTVHLFAEAMRRAYRDRAELLGDPDAGFALPALLLDKSYAAGLRAAILPERATPSLAIAGGLAIVPDEGEHTTHLTVADSRGNFVSLTTTINDLFGSGLVAAGTGVLMNDEMDDFNKKRGHTTPGGEIGTPPNLVAPGKRMLSSMAPTFVLRGGRVVLALGTPGGKTIPNSVLVTIAGVVDFGLSARRAVDRPRFHHKFLPDEIVLEPGALDARGRAALEAMGHALKDAEDPQGDVHAIAWTGSGYEGVADRRIDGGVAVE